ncbi:GGDEF domain-containing protein [Sulfurimonas sp.]|uniref:GGDEF domain-containing protein n=1 Tax=Sulfurimonas sp. TaxID=2022749 RepID=UPI0025DD1E99|nr:GGDEF domain-containing protein [Sulfurimonas sp.]
MIHLKKIIKNHLKSTNEEISQAIARVIITLAITVSMIVFNLIQTQYIYLMSVYFIFSIVHLKITFKYPAFRKWRIIFTIWADITFTTLMLYSLNEIGTFFFPLYFWYIMGNGMRFGKAYLIVASLYSFFSFFILINTSLYWSSNPSFAYAILSSLFILPLFFYVLVSRLHDAQKQLKDQLAESKYTALFDTLTSIPNRHYLLQKLYKYETQEIPITLFFIDLDGFKLVNDTLGHYVGDEVLIEVAKRLTDLTDENHFVARLGGDEFAYILKNSDKAMYVAKKMGKNQYHYS